MGETIAQSRPGGPEPRWLLLPLPGIVAGSVFGVLVVWLAVLIVALGGRSTGGALSGALVLSVIGAVYGAIIGLVCNVPVALVLTFLVGRDLPEPLARSRAFVGGVVTHVVALVLLLAAMGFGFNGIGTMLVIGSPLVGGLVAWWFQGRLATRRRRADAHPH